MQITHLDKQQFLSRFDRLVEELYQAGDSTSNDQNWLVKRGYVMGYAASGKELKLATEDDIQRVIDKAHLKVFGETREARRERLNVAVEGDDEVDWSKFDSPTFERKSTRS